MIPTFPKFKKLELSDRQQIESITTPLPPYSDFNFVSLWSWDTDGSIELSKLHGNLVIKMPDYVTNEVIFSFIGTKKVDDTIKELTKYARSVGADPVLKLIPKIVVEHIKKPTDFVVTQDRDNFDYVIDVTGLIDMYGQAYRNIRNEVNRFRELHEAKAKLKPLDLSRKKVQGDILRVFEAWEKSRHKTREETENELIALNKLLSASTQLDLEAIGIYMGDKLVAFSIYEVIQFEYGIGHFHKADTRYKGIFHYLEHHAARNIKDRVKYINYEQDLGLEGLRKSKIAHRPKAFLEKYTVGLK